MPYIDQERRELWKFITDKYDILIGWDKGDLEYLIARLVHQYLKTHDHRYTHIHDAVYAVEHVAHEVRRLVLDPYEDEKKETNGACI